MFRKTAFWIAFALVSASAVVYALRNFSKAFPLVSVDIRMDRKAALDAGRAMAARYGWGPAAFDQAASFSVDQEVQNFVELEGGGKEALREMIRQKTYAPYTWQVRNFREGDAHEVTMRFTPEGDPYGFSVKLPEKESGASLEPDAARRIAEDAAVKDWQVDLSQYPLAESSQITRPGGRKDHTFVYERQDMRIGEGRFRLRLVVAGDKPAQLAYFVQVPEAFTRRYTRMRSANDAISVIAAVGVVLYLLGFCGAGLFYMIRQQWLIWRPAVTWGLIISAMAALAEVNSWPLVWMTYDTALPASGFAIRQITAILGLFLANGLVFSVSFMAAETLSRRAFPRHIQFWRIWSTPVAASRQVLGRTLAGYLTVGVFIAYVIAFYAFTQRALGWWTPSDTLVNPDLFAAYVPSFSAIALSAQAGFWEECLFRAVPLAALALIGDRLGRRRAFIIAGLVVQAIVFGAGHAGYANQPSYARVVELIVPSMTFAGFFLAFGLLPGIVMHYTFDAVLMSLPIFASTTPRAHVEQFLAALLIFVPLWIVLIARIRMGRWIDLPADARNGGWAPSLNEDVTPPAETEVRPTGSMPPAIARFAPAAAVIVLALWASLSHFKSDAPPLSISRPAAESAARESVKPDSSWTVLSRVNAEPGDDDRYVWQKAGAERYATLMGTYLSPPGWLVRFARFQGDVAERAEEYQVLVAGDGRPYRTRHILPEAKAGASPPEAEARALAQSALEQAFQVSIGDFQEVSAEVKKRPSRADWSLEFKDKRDFGLREVELRAAVELAGDQIADTSRYIHVPEEWARNERRLRNVPDILSRTASVLGIGILFAGAVVAAMRWSRGRGFSSKTFVRVGGFLFVINAIAMANNWKSGLSQLQTAQPYAVEAGVMLIAGALTAFVLSGTLGLVSGLVAHLMGKAAGFRVGLAAGVALAGVRALAGAVAPSMGPGWGDFGPAGASIPLLAAAIGPFSAFITQALLLSLVFHAVHRLWTRRRATAIGLLMVMGLVLGGRSIESIPSWIVGGLLIGAALVAVYVVVLRYQPGAVIPVVAAMTVVSALREGLRMNYPAALPGAVLAATLILLASHPRRLRQWGLIR